MHLPVDQGQQILLRTAEGIGLRRAEGEVTVTIQTQQGLYTVSGRACTAARRAVLVFTI